MHSLNQQALTLLNVGWNLHRFLCYTLKRPKQNFKAEPSYCPSQVITCVEWIPAQWVEDQGCLGIEVGVFQPGPRSAEHWGQDPPPIHYLHSKIKKLNWFFFEIMVFEFFKAKAWRYKNIQNINQAISKQIFLHSKTKQNTIHV